MTVPEHDLELLEEWLDGELPEARAEEVRARISREPLLATALDQLRADRQLRTRLWQGLTPGDAEVDSLISGVRRSVRKEEVWSVRFRALRNVSGVAAALALVFMAGWISRTRLQVGPVPSPGTPTAVATNSKANAPRAVGTVPQTAGVNPGGSDLLVQVPVDAHRMSKVRPVYRLVLIDPIGRPVSVQQLENIDDPAKLNEELAQFLGRLQPNAPRGNAPTLVNEPKP